MKLLIRMTLIVMALGIAGCDKNDNDDDSFEPEELQSFSSFVRETFDNDKDDEALSVIEGVDFQFEDADELETYSDLLADDD